MLHELLQVKDANFILNNFDDNEIATMINFLWNYIYISILFHVFVLLTCTIIHLCVRNKSIIIIINANINCQTYIYFARNPQFNACITARVLIRFKLKKKRFNFIFRFFFVVLKRNDHFSKTWKRSIPNFRYETIKAANELEAEKFEEQLRNIQKKMQSMEGQFDGCTEDLFNQTIKETRIINCKIK